MPIEPTEQKPNGNGAFIGIIVIIIILALGALYLSK